MLVLLRSCEEVPLSHGLQNSQKDATCLLRPRNKPSKPRTCVYNRYALTESLLSPVFCARPAGMAMALARGNSRFPWKYPDAHTRQGRTSKNAIFFENTNQSMPAPLDAGIAPAHSSHPRRVIGLGLRFRIDACSCFRVLRANLACLSWHKQPDQGRVATDKADQSQRR
jgi:hypothetical protein